MRVVALARSAVALALLLAGCSGIAATTNPTLVPGSPRSDPVPPAGRSAAPGPVTFVSGAYGYSVTLPDGWFGRQAVRPWDGIGAPEHAGPVVDQWVGPSVPVAWANAAPTAADLPAYAAERAAAESATHPCPASPELEQAISIDGVPAILQSKHCPADTGILVMAAYTVHNGVGYVFMYQDRAMRPGNAHQSADERAFASILATISLSR